MMLSKIVTLSSRDSLPSNVQNSLLPTIINSSASPQLNQSGMTRVGIPKELVTFLRNINRISSKSLGNKLRNPDCLRMINNFDFSETLKSVSILLEGFKIVNTGTLRNRKCGRSTGGLAVIFKSKFYDWISVEEESPNFLMVQGYQGIYKNGKRSPFMWRIYPTS